MRSCPKLAALVWALPALLSARSAFAEDPPPEAKPEDAKPKEEEFKPPSGYQPGSSRAIGLGLSPWTPRTPSMPGGATVPYGAPQEEPGMYELDFSGYMSAALRLSSWSPSWSSTARPARQSLPRVPARVSPRPTSSATPCAHTPRR